MDCEDGRGYFTKEGYNHLNIQRHERLISDICQIMGIPSFYSGWIQRHDRNASNTSSIIVKRIPQEVVSFSIDMNGLIHSAAQQTYAYGEHDNKKRREVLSKMPPSQLELMFFSNVTNELSRVLQQCRPSQLLVMAVDGVAPRSKINQQRSRRYRSVKEASPGSIFNSSSITPGTDLMHRLDLHLQQFILDISSGLPPKVIYSSHRIPGEGEHKIMDLMRDGSTYTETGPHLLYGLDADLIMLSLLVPIRGIHLIREDLRDIIRIDSVRILVENLMTPGDVVATDDTYRDFVLLSYFIGNDFLPHMPSMESLGDSFDLLLELYRINGGVTITNGTDIDWGVLGDIIQAMADQEPFLIEKEARRSVKYPSSIIKSAMTYTTIHKNDGETGKIIEKNVIETSKLDFDAFRSRWYSNALLPKVEVFKGIDELLPTSLGVEDISEICRSYLTGIGWIFNYYQKNWEGVDIDWYYPYYYTPLFTDLADFLSIGGRPDDYSPKETEPYSPIHQLLAVIPKQSYQLLPIEVQHLVDLSSPIVDLYPSDFIIDLEGKNYEHQGVVLLPFVDMNRIIEAVNSTTEFSPERAELFSIDDLLIVEMNQEQAREYNKNSGRIERGGSRGGRGGRGRGDSRGRGRGNTAAWKSKTLLQ